MFQKISQIEEGLVKQKGKKRLALAGSHDQPALEAVLEAHRRGYIEPVLFGKLKETKNMASVLGYDLSAVECHDIDDIGSSVQQAVQAVSSGEAQVLMKGASGTAELMRGILNKEWGLRTGGLLSHLAMFEIPGYARLLSLTDVAISIAPGFEDKTQITKNAIDFLHAIGNQSPNVAIIAAVEKVYEAMPATLDAEKLVELAKSGYFGRCTMEGPLALDNAISKESAEHKGIDSQIAGQADLLVMPQIESGNVLYKALNLFTKCKVAAVVLGAKAPVVLTSRSDSHEAKLNSILLAAFQNR